MLDSRVTVAQIVLDHSECAAVLQRLRIDFCCRGDLSVEAACKERGLDTAAVLLELDHAIARRGDEAPGDPRALSTVALVGHIVSRHHEYLRQALPFVRGLAAKVSRVHGEHNPKLVALDAVVGELCAALEPHLDAEEATLFPQVTSAAPDRAVVLRELASMHEEHLAVGGMLARLRDASDEFALPAWACNSYRTLFAELEQMEGDILRHVHLENHVLMPRFVDA